MGTPSPRGTESTLPGRVSAVRNVVTPSRSGHRPVSRPQGRPNSSAGLGWFEKRMPVAERQQETGTTGLLLPAAVPHNWPDTGVCLARKGADVDQVSH